MANITLFAGNFAPKNWMMCNGALLNINTNQALFSLLGTTYGGNGVQTFGLPNLQGRVPVGTGTGQGLPSIVLGEMSGSPTNTMTLVNMPQHTHAANVSVQMPVNAAPGVTDNPESGYFATAASGAYSATAGGGQALGALTVNATLQPAGGSQPIPNMMPYLALNYVICCQGIYPSRP